MKNFLILLLSIFICSCSTDSSESIEQENGMNLNQKFINYSFNGTIYQVKYTIDENDEAIPIKNETYNRLESIVDKNENLIFHYIDEFNYILFQSDSELENYLEEIGAPLQKYSKSSKSVSPYDESNLFMYVDSYFNGAQIYWGYPGYTGNQGCYQYSTPENRLKNFDVPYNWTVHTVGPYVCGNNSSFGNNPNDKVSSLVVNNVFARFYEHANYGGKSITRDARGGGTSSFNRLKSVGMGLFGNWDNEISSAKLSY